MNDMAFRALLDIMMCDDPSNTEPAYGVALEEFANEESKKRDYDSWYDAYHCFKPTFEVK